MIEPEPALVRGLGRWDLAGLMMNATIGAGILGLPGRAYALAGIWCVPLCIAGGLLMALVAACFAQAGSRFNRTGGAYLFVYEAFGPEAGFVMGWLTFVTRLLSFATIANLVLTYVSALLPWVATGSGRFVAISALVTLLSAPVYFGVRLSARAHNLFTSCKLALLLGFVAISLPSLIRHGVVLTPLPPIGQVIPCILVLLFGLMGVEAAAINNGEMRDPARDIPFAFAVGLTSVMALYSFVLLGSVALVPDLAHSARPLYDGATAVLGPAGGVTVVVGGAISMTGVLFVILFIGPREMFALAQNGQLPDALTRLHPRYRTPFVAIVIYAGLAWLLTLNSSFLGALTAATLTRLMTYAATAAASLRLTRRDYCETPAPLLLPGGRAFAWLALSLCGAIISQSTPAEFISVGAALAPGIVMLTLRGRMRTRPAATPSDSL